MSIRLAPTRARWAAGLMTAVLVAAWPATAPAQYVGDTGPTSFSLCEAETDDTGGVRPECQASDLRLQLASGTGDRFGYSLAAGLINGDDLVDLVVGDPGRNRVYLFFGRPSPPAAYGLTSDLLERAVDAEARADIILYRDPEAPAQVVGFGHALAVSRRQDAAGCGEGKAAALLIGAPGDPSVSGNAPGTVFYLPPGSLCLAAAASPTPDVIDPATLGVSFFAAEPAPDDLFGYAVAFGQVLASPGSADDLVVAATGALEGAGRVTVFPVSGTTVTRTGSGPVRILGEPGDALGEVLAVGDLDLDFDEDTRPRGGLDDLAMGAVGAGAGKVVLAQGGLAATGGSAGNGVFRQQMDSQIRVITGEVEGDYLGFSVAISPEGALAAGAVLADNDPPLPGGEGGDGRSNVASGSRLQGGKVYRWDPGFLEPGPDIPAAEADLVLVARRSGDQLGFAVLFDELDGTPPSDLVATARREDGTGLTVNEIDQGTAYVLFTAGALGSPADLSLCAPSSDCTGVAGIEVMIFGGDRRDGKGDEMGFALASGDFNGDGAPDLFISAPEQQRVYVVTLQDSDDDREIEGRNIRDEDDDGDGDPDVTDCAPADPEIFTGAEEIACNDIDENCNGMDDDTPDVDGDGFDACGSATVQVDCDDDDAASFPGADEVCDGNDNNCDGAVPSNELDSDGDGWVICSAWSDTQGDQPDIQGGGDCDAGNASTFPGSAELESAEGCYRDVDGDGFGALVPPSGVASGTDCDDSRADTFPGAAPLDDPLGCLRDEDDDDYGEAAAPSPVADGSDCNDRDARTYPGAPELCDGNANVCGIPVPDDETDPDADGWVACSGWDDTQGDNAVIKGGGDCAPDDRFTFPGSARNEVEPGACLTDKDGDGYGDQTPEPEITPGTDCDDDSPAGAVTFPGAAPLDSPETCMKDGDGDDYGDEAVSLPVVPGSDCDDSASATFAGADEIPDDGIDQDCNGFDTVTCYADGDGDGFGGSTVLLAADGDCDDAGESALDTDCDDADPAVSPGVSEIVGDGIDQDCNGFDAVVCFVDADQDGFGTTAQVVAPDGTCDAEDGESGVATDCDDGDPATHPGAAEVCDGNANTCSGQVPAGEQDGDGDGWVACSGWSDTQGDQPQILGGGDCAPAEPDAFPGAAEKESFSTACMLDNDGDGYGSVSPPSGVSPGTDCDDASAFGDATYPGAAPLDNALSCMRDVDGDDYGDEAAVLPVVKGSDCADSDATIFPGAAQLCDGDDNSCAGAVPADEIDQDGDGWVACAGWSDTQGNDPAIAGGGDCDEADAATFPGSAENEPFEGACMRDADGDGFGDLQPPAGVAAGSDCDDADPNTFKGAAPADSPLVCMRDADGDDYGDSAAILPVTPGTDCDDGEAGASPGGLEGPPGDATCTGGIDNDCDGLVDGDDPGCQTVVECPDADSDGFADCASNPLCDDTGLVCGDCNDANPDVHPGGAEVCDGLDNDCSGVVDEGFDQDGDGFTTCALPFADCNDSDPQVNPGEQETCGDGVDNDCDPSTPDLFDLDGDGASCADDCDDGNPALNQADADGDGYSTCAGDCDDANDAVSPGAAEVCADGIDNDCNPATVDVGDADGDGATCATDCDDTDPDLNLADADDDGFSTCAGDCDDGNAAISPSAEDVCDGIDNNCNGVVDEAFDLDGDGYSTCQQPVPDCDDGNAAVNPGATEVCGDGIDNDCNPATEDLGDADGDGFACNLDCDDADGTTYPGAAERCDGNINACGGTLPAGELDLDGDGYVACSPWLDSQGDNPSILGGGDCAPSSADTFPGAAPLESVPTACMRDRDGDDYGDLEPPAGVVAGTDCDDLAADTFKGAAPLDSPVVCMKDSDSDDYGDQNVGFPVTPGSDCADDDATRNIGATETCGDGIDSDCDGSDPVCPAGGGTVQAWVESPDILGWSDTSGGLYHVYQGDLDALRAGGVYTQEPDGGAATRSCSVTGGSLEIGYTPAPGQAVFALVAPAGEGDPVGGDLGIDSAGRARPSHNPCP